MTKIIPLFLVIQIWVEWILFSFSYLELRTNLYGIRSITLASLGRNKLGLIDGTCSKDMFSKELWGQWERVNVVVLLWLMKTIINTILTNCSSKSKTQPNSQKRPNVTQNMSMSKQKGHYGWMTTCMRTLLSFKLPTIVSSNITQPRVPIVPTYSDFENQQPSKNLFKSIKDKDIYEWKHYSYYRVTQGQIPKEVCSQLSTKTVNNMKIRVWT